VSLLLKTISFETNLCSSKLDMASAFPRRSNTLILKISLRSRKGSMIPPGRQMNRVATFIRGTSKRRPNCLPADALTNSVFTFVQRRTTYSYSSRESPRGYHRSTYSRLSLWSQRVLRSPPARQSGCRSNRYEGRTWIPRMSWSTRCLPENEEAR
jgi:hypothetical protein